MSDEKVGIQNLKEMVMFSLKVGESIESAVSHGPTAVATLAKLMNTVQLAPAAFSDMSQIPHEAWDVDADEKAELVASVKAAFDLENDAAEAMVEKGIEAAMNLLGIIKLFAA